MADWTDPAAAHAQRHTAADLLDIRPGEHYWVNVLWSNVTSQRHGVYRPHRMSVIVFGSVICVWTILANLLLCGVLCRRRRGVYLDSFRPLKWLVLNFSLAQLLISVVVVPLNIHIEKEGQWFFGATLCRLWLCIQVLSVSLSTWSLVMIALDRLVYSINPRLYRDRMSRVKAGVLIIISWVVAFFTLATPAYYMTDRDFVLEEMCAVSMSHTYAFAISSSAFFCPAIIVVLATITSLLATAVNRCRYGSHHGYIQGHTGALVYQPKGSQQLQQQQQHTYTNTDSLRAGLHDNQRHWPSLLHAMEGEQDVANVSVVMVITQVVILGMWAPFYVSNVLIPLCVTESRMCIDPTLWSLFIWIGYSSCGLAPLLWLLDRRLRADCFSLLRCGKRLDEGPGSVMTVDRVHTAFYWENDNIKQFLNS